MEIQGDPEWKAEQFRITLTPLTETDGPGQGGEKELTVRRMGDCLQVDDLEIGSYRVLLQPMTGELPSMSMAQALTLDVEIKEDEQAHQLVELVQGAGVHIAAGAFAGSSHKNFRLYDAHGSVVEVIAESREPQGRYRSSSDFRCHRYNALLPVLPPGTYTLEVWDEGEAPRSIPLVLRSGEISFVPGD